MKTARVSDTKTAPDRILTISRIAEFIRIEKMAKAKSN